MSISRPRSCARAASGSRKANAATRAASRRGDAFMGRPSPEKLNGGRVCVNGVSKLNARRRRLVLTMRRSAVPWRRGQRDKRPDQPVGTASAASFWWHGPDQELAAEAAPAGFAGAEAAAAAVAVAVAVDLDLRGPSGAAESADKTP